METRVAVRDINHKYIVVGGIKAWTPEWQLFQLL